MRETGTPIWVGEFGPVYVDEPAADDMRYQVLRDQLEIYDRYQASLRSVILSVLQNRPRKPRALTVG